MQSFSDLLIGQQLQQGKNYNNASPLAYLPQYHIEIIFFVGNIVDHIVISFAGSDAVFWLKKTTSEM